MTRTEPGDQLREAFSKAIDLCREGEWNDGLLILGRIAESGRAASLPGTYYSYLGYAIARLQRRTDEGLKLCRHALKVQFYEPENYLNLARTALLASDRKEAVRAVLGGLKVDPGSLELGTIYRELGIRQAPVLPFLSRANPLNLLLGRVRMWIFGPAVRPLDAPPPVVARRSGDPQKRTSV
jgi:hypothetical protein